MFNSQEDFFFFFFAWWEKNVGISPWEYSVYMALWMIIIACTIVSERDKWSFLSTHHSYQEGISEWKKGTLSRRVTFTVDESTFIYVYIAS